MKWKEVVVEALAGFVAWTLLLTPYMILVVKLTLDQYFAWVAASAVLSPPCAPIVIRFTNLLKERMLVEGKNKFS